MNLDAHQLETLIPLVAIAFGTTGVVMPAILFSQARRIIRDHEHLAGLLIGTSALICVVGILVAGIVVLALVGWLPPPAELLGGR